MRRACAVLAIAQETGPLSSPLLVAIHSVRLVHSQPTMVDSPKERTMTDGSSNLPERVEVIEQKLDGLIQSVDVRFAQVDVRFAQVDARFEEVNRRFDQVDAAIVEQRAYTEFAYEKLDAKMDAGFARLDQKIDNGLQRVDGRFDRLERKIDQLIDLHMPKTPPNTSDLQ
jgi:hypothetical protein